MMAVRHSEYARRRGDQYVTPRWVWDVLYSVEPQFREAFDCAPAIRNGYDFLTDRGIYKAIATNPPYGRLAERFVRHALSMPGHPPVAMLLPHAWDCAKTRRDLFENPRFKAKYTLVDRIRWANLKQKAAGPSSNHAFYVWSKAATRKPVMGWLPLERKY